MGLELKKSNLSGIVRVEANSKIGAGHAMRGLALCAMLNQRTKLTLAARSMPDSLRQRFNELGVDYLDLATVDQEKEYYEIKNRIGDPDFIIVDGYGALRHFKKAVVNNCRKFISVEDHYDIEFPPDVLINHSPGASADRYNISKNTTLCLGLDFAILQSCFNDRSQLDANKSKPSGEGVCINFGGSDPQNITEKFLSVLVTETDHKINVVMGPLSENFASIQRLAKDNPKRVTLHSNLGAVEIQHLFKTSKIGLFPPSTIAFEAMACQLPIIVGWVELNQKIAYRGITGANLGLGLGELLNVSKERMLDAINGLASSDELQLTMSERQALAIDGRSPQRIRSVILGES